MSHDEFTKLFKYMERKFESVDRRFEAMDKKFDFLIGTMDAFAKRMEIYDHERLALGHQVGRHDRWIHKLSDGTGIKLSAT